MGLIGELTIHDPILFVPTFQRVPEAVSRFEDFHYVTDEDANVHYVFFWWTTGCEFTAFERALGDDPTVAAFRVVTELADERLYRIVTKQFPAAQPLVFPIFREHHITTLEAKRTANGLELKAIFPSRETLKSFLDAAKEIGEATTVASIYSEDPTGAAPDPLTRKQRDALMLALERGYFETPSQATLEELAGELDIAPQTLSRHLRLGVKTLVERGLDLESERIDPGGRFKDASG